MRESPVARSRSSSCRLRCLLRIGVRCAPCDVFELIGILLQIVKLLGGSLRCRRHVVNAYVEHYLESRTHVALRKDAPVSSPSAVEIVAIPHLGTCAQRERW
jgi:hypothetical protein